MESPLTTKQKAFALAWVDLFSKGKENGTEAARVAGYKGNDGVLAVQAHANLRNPKIKHLIQNLRKDIDRAAGSTQLGDIMCAAEVLARVSALARANPLDLFNEEGEFDHDDVRRRGLGYLMSAVETVSTTYPNGTVTVRKKFRVEPRKGFLELLGKHLGLWDNETPDYDEILARIAGVPKALLPANLEPDPNASAVDGDVVDEEEERDL